MKSFITVLLIFLAIYFAPAPAHSQAVQALDSTDLGFGVVSNVGVYYLDGSFKIFEAPIAGGIVFKRWEWLWKPGLYLAPTLTNSDNVEEQAKLATIFYVTLLRKMSLGFGYSFWISSLGVVEPKKENLFFALSIKLTE
ncbi:MAG: hypothetical protein GXO75_15470 [Calditrichaeota bacterium]|nr:hypothetical protein [Calditrichota bacterium]